MSGLEVAATVATIVGIVASPLFQSIFESLKKRLKRPHQPNEPSEQLKKLEDAIGNIPLLLQLAKSIEDRTGVRPILTQLRKAVYAAEDLVDELDYKELQLKILGPAAEATAVQPLPGAGRNSSSQVGCFAQLKMFFNECVTQLKIFFTECFRHCHIIANGSAPHPSHNKVTTKRIRSTVEELNRVASLLKDACSLVTASSHTSAGGGKQEGSTMLTDPSRVTTSTIVPRMVYGRDKQKKEIIKMLESKQIHGKESHVSIITIVGVGGVGKTTLARYVFDDAYLQEFFDFKVWICASNEYKKERIIREIIIGTASRVETSTVLQSTMSIDALESMLKEKVNDKRVLVVLDDVRGNQWTQIMLPLEISTKLCKIIVTTREKKNLELPVAFSDYCESQILELEGLDDAAYRNFFNVQAFGTQDPSKHPKIAILQPIGWQIAKKLKGNPLAAETVGAVLRQRLDIEHWNRVQDSDLWGLGNQELGDIMPALMLSYLYLPANLQRCFSYCAIFPVDSDFEKDDLVNMWIAQSYISCSKDDESPEDVGLQQFEELVLRSFFTKPIERGHNYKMHDLLHDLAMFVSLKECCVYNLENCHGDLDTCNHLSIPESLELPGILTGQLPESLMLQLEHARTLAIDSFDETAPEIFKSLKKIRVLKCFTINVPQNEVTLPNIGHLIHIRYLDLSTIRISNVPESICTLYHLQTLIFESCIEIKFPEQMCNLVNLRHLITKETSIARIQFIGKLSKLQELAIFDCQYNNIRELIEMNELGDKLEIMNIGNVEKIDDAVNARLEKKHRLKRLKLVWRTENYLSLTSTNELGSGVGSEHHDDVLECLRPNEQLEGLDIMGHPGYKPPSWIAPSSLKYIQCISLSYCSHWRSLSSIAKMPYLESLSMVGMSLVIELGDEVAFPSLGELKLEKVSVSFRKREEAAIVHGMMFPRLQRMSLIDCQKLEGLIGPSSLEHLRINKSNIELPAFLKGLSSLTTLKISHQDRFISFNREVMDSLSSLKILTIENCKNLRSLPEGRFPTSLEELDVFECSPELHYKLKNLKSTEWSMIASFDHTTRLRKK